jgi:hypothetical protein
MHLTLVRDVGLTAKLTPHLHGLVPRCCDVAGHVSLLIAKFFSPCVLMFLADPLASRIVMISAQVQSVDASGTAMDENVAQRPGIGIPTADDENGSSVIRANLDAKFAGRRMVCIFSPINISQDALGGVRENDIEFLPRKHTHFLPKLGLSTLDILR